MGTGGTPPLWSPDICSMSMSCPPGGGRLVRPATKRRTYVDRFWKGPQAAFGPACGALGEPEQIEVNMVKPHGGLVLVGSCVTAFRPPAYQPGYLPGSFRGLEGPGLPNLEGGFPLRCFQRLSLPSIATQRLPLARQLVHQRLVHSGPLVLRAAPLKQPTSMADRDRTVSRRSEPSSRTALIGEQPNPWDLLQPQDAMSRHRGAKPCRRCGLLGKISLLSPEYLLSVK